MRSYGCHILFLIFHISNSFILPSTVPQLQVRKKHASMMVNDLATGKKFLTVSLSTRSSSSRTDRGGPRGHQANREFKEKRMQDKLNRQLNKFLTACQSDHEMPSQASCDNLLAICAASNEWDKYEMAVGKMADKGISIEKNTYSCILKECFTQGNGVSAVKVLNLMQSHSTEMKPNQDDLKLAIGALCRNNKYERGLWKKALQLIHLAAAAIERGDMDISLGTLHVDAYNEVLQCMETHKRWEDALDLLEMMEAGSGFHASPNQGTYHRVLNALISSSQVDTAAELLFTLSKERQDSPTIYLYEIVLSALLDKRQRNVKWQQAITLLDSMHELKISIPTVMFNKVIAACAKAKQTNAARDLFHKMKAQKVQPDTVTYNSLISVAANTGRAKDALTLFRMCNEDTGVDIITYTNTIRACAQCRMSKKAMELLEDAKKNNMPLDAFIYTATIDACAKSQMWKDALKLLDDMRDNNVLPNQYTYSSAITACGNCGKWKQSLDLLKQMKDKNMKVSTITYNAAISALSKGARQNIKDELDFNIDKQNLWIKALELLDEMKSKRIWPDVYTYSGIISTCASGGRYKEALDLIKVMQSGPPRVRPNKIAYTGAISACGRAGEWSHALQLFVNMKTDRIKCDVVAYNALMSAFANGGEPGMCFQLWNDMCGKGTGEFSGGAEQVPPDIITLTSVVASFDRIDESDNAEKVDSVFADAVERQIIFADTMDTKWEIDLSGMSLPVARAACRFILSQIRDTKDTENYQDLNLITGVGRHHQEPSAKVVTTALREYVQQILLEDFSPPLKSEIPERTPGVILVKRDSIERWEGA